MNNYNFDKREIRRMNREYYKDVAKEIGRKAALTGLWSAFSVCILLGISSIVMMTVNCFIL